MMTLRTLLALPLGLLLPTLSGWLGLRLVEGQSPVLFRAERWVTGGLLGLTLCMFFSFLAQMWLGVPFTFWSFFAIQAALTLILGFLYRRYGDRSRSPAPPREKLSRPVLWIVAALGAWTVLRLLTGATLLVTTRPFLDDTIDNWNLRGKVFFVDQRLTLELPAAISAPAGGVSSYPPTVPLAKTWLSTIAGEWNESLVNSIHFLWFVAVIAMLYFALRRATSFTWALIGTYMLVSLPLELMHGTNAYADMFLSAHVFAAVAPLFFAARSDERAERLSFFRVSAIATALLPFTKNEGFAIYFMGLALVLAATLFILWRRRALSLRDLREIALWYAVPLFLVLVPWLSFKWAFGLPFGNAKNISGLRLNIEPKVFNSVYVTTFFEANWLFLPALLLLMLGIRFRSAFRSALTIPVAFFLMMYVGEFLLFLLTSLSTEALYQTGYGRGVTHLMPLMVLATTILLSELWSHSRARGS
jgi:hypothetical protein